MLYSASVKIYAAEIITYELNGWTWTDAEIIRPQWEVLANELVTMDKFRKLLIYLRQRTENFEEDWMGVCGGNGVYHVQICVDEKFYQYFDVSRSSKEFDVWTSDQGFSCPEFHLIFADDLLLKIVKYYYDFGTYCPDATWTGIDI